EQPDRARERVGEREQPGEADDDGEDRERGEPRVRAGVARARQHALLAEEQPELIEHVAAGEQEEEEPGEDRQMRTRGDRERAREVSRGAQVRRRLDLTERDARDAARAVDERDARGGQDDRHDEPAPRELEEREREEVEPYVTAEDRVGGSERRPVL